MSNIDELLATAFELYETNQILQAKAICHSIVSQEPEHIDALCLLGAIAHQLETDQLKTKPAETKPADVGLDYHLWYYNTSVYGYTSWLGVITWKSVADMWNYQEIIFSLKPSLIIEFGTFMGGSALFFASVLKSIGHKSKILSVDIDHSRVSPLAKLNPQIELMLDSSTSPQVATKIAILKQEFPGKIFAILDSNHTKEHVLGEMLLLRPILKSGDYLVVEDSNINGHPVLPGWGEGPYEAMQEYFSRYPDDYVRDRDREQKFGFTFATEGFLVRR
jgi:cephalosporin hydroxylase